MQKNLFVLALCGSVLASPLRAVKSSDSVERLVQRLARVGSYSPTTSNSSEHIRGCANFSGEWEGECIENGTPIPGKMRTSIRQGGCMYIRYEGVDHLIGGSTQVDLVAPRGTLAPLAENLKQSYLPNWSEDRQKLLVRLTALSHTIDAFNTGNTLVSGQQIWAMPSPGVLKMETDLHFDGFLGAIVVKQDIRVECTYQKL